MKIVVIGPVYPYRGGIAHYTTLLVKALQDAGHVVKVISFKRQYPKWLYPGETDRDPSQQPLTVPATYLLDPLYPWTWQQAVNATIEENPDLVLFQWWTTFWALAFAFISRRLKAKNIRVGYLIHNVIPHEARPWDKFLAKMALRQGNGFIVLSDSQQGKLQTLIPSAKILLTDLPVFDMFSPQRIEKGTARRILGIPEGLPVVLFFGIVRPYKGLKLLVEAMGTLADEDLSAGLYIAGEFWEDVKTYTDQIERLGLKGKVWIDNRYVPNEEVPVIFSAVDVFAAPYTSHATQSAAVKMALGFGLPVAVTEPVVDDTMRPWINQGVYVCPTEDPSSLKEAILRAIKAGPASVPTIENSAGWQSLVDCIQQL